MSTYNQLELQTLGSQPDYVQQSPWSLVCIGYFPSIMSCVRDNEPNIIQIHNNVMW